MLSPAVTPSSNLKPRSPRMHPFRKLREGGPMTPAQVAVLLNEDIVMHTPILIKPIVGRELVSFAVSISSQSGDDPGLHP